MNNTYSSPISDNHDEYPEITQADLDRAKFPVGLKPALSKQQTSILIDTSLVEYFQAKARDCDYQTLINQTLHEVMQIDFIESALRRIIREELRHGVHSNS